MTVTFIVRLDEMPHLLLLCLQIPAIVRIPSDRTRIAESGIRTADDMARLQAAGADGFLIGTTLMRAERPAAKLRELL